MKKRILLVILLAICMIHITKGTSSISLAADKPKPEVEYEEVELKKAKIESDSKGKAVYSAVVKNHSKTGTVKKIQYYYQIKVLKEVEVTVPETPEPVFRPEETGVVDISSDAVQSLGTEQAVSRSGRCQPSGPRRPRQCRYSFP